MQRSAQVNFIPVKDFTNIKNSENALQKVKQLSCQRKFDWYADPDPY